MTVPSLSPNLQRAGLHLGFWLGLWALLSFDVLEATLRGESLTKAAVYAWVVLSCAATTYANNYALLPRLLRRQHYAAYVAALVGLVLTASWLNDVLLGYWIGTQSMLADRFVTLLTFTVFTTGLKLLRDDSRVRLKVSTLERIQAEQELQLLRSQVQPHFLFNTLNGLYALALRDSVPTADMLLKLAELLRYMVTTAPLPRVVLAREVAYLENYLALEKIRLNPVAHVALRQQGALGQVHIAPMLLLPFVENAFKHGVETQVNNVRVEIDVSLQGNELFFQISNSKPGRPYPGPAGPQTGLANVGQRLALLYPQRHELTLVETDTTYQVNLWLHL